MIPFKDIEYLLIFIFCFSKSKENKTTATVNYLPPFEMITQEKLHYFITCQGPLLSPLAIKIYGLWSVTIIVVGHFKQ